MTLFQSPVLIKPLKCSLCSALVWMLGVRVLCTLIKHWAKINHKLFKECIFVLRLVVSVYFSTNANPIWAQITYYIPRVFLKPGSGTKSLKTPKLLRRSSIITTLTIQLFRHFIHNLNSQNFDESKQSWKDIA